MLVRPPTISDPLRLACERIYNEPRNESQISGITSLSQPQRKAILEALKACNLSTPEQRNRLVEEIKEDSRITRIVHLAITSSSDDLDKDYQAFDQVLTKSILDKLEVVAKIEDSNTRANAIDAWLTQYQSHFDQKTLEALEPTDLYRLTSRLIQCECSELPAYKAIFQNLPEAGREYAELLQLPLADFWKKTCETHRDPSQEPNRYTALAYYIACKKLPMAEVAKQLTEQELQALMPYLRYGDFTRMESGKAERLLSNCMELAAVN